MYGHVGQPTNYSLMNEVYETERIVSIQSEDSFVSDSMICDVWLADCRPFVKRIYDIIVIIIIIIIMSKNIKVTLQNHI